MTSTAILAVLSKTKSSAILSIFCRLQVAPRAWANSRFTVLASGLLVLVLASGAAGTTIQLDQSNLILPPSSGLAIFTNGTYAQTFTVGLGGRLARAEMQVWKSPTTTGEDVTFRVLSTLPDGSPDPSVAPLYEVIIPLDSIAPDADSIPDVPPLLAVDLLPANISVSSGDVLAVSLSRVAAGSPPWVLWGSTGPDTYALGRSYTSADDSQTWGDVFGSTPLRDVGFRTYVEIPEPSSLAMLLLATLAILSHRRTAGK